MNDHPSPSTEGSSPEEDLAGGAWVAFHPAARLESPLADRKALAILGAYSLMITVLSFAAHSIYRLARASPPTMEAMTLLLLATLIASLLLGAAAAWIAFITPAPPAPTTLAHFRDIAALNPAEYAGQMSKLETNQALEAILLYNHSFAIQTRLKFQRLRHALSCLRLAMAAWIILMVLLAVRG